MNGIIEAGYLNQGQICAAAERFYLPQGKLDAVLALLKDRLSAFAPGSPLDEQTLMGPLANRQQYDKVLRLIQTAREEGIPSSAAAKRCPARAISCSRRRLRCAAKRAP